MDDGAAGAVISTEKIKQAEVVIGGCSAVMDADGCRIRTDNMSADINSDNIVFNGGGLDGMVIIQKLTDKLNELKDTVNDLISKYNAHVHLTTATVGAGTTVGTISAIVSKATPAKAFNKADYENDKIRQ